MLKTHFVQSFWYTLVVLIENIKIISFLLIKIVRKCFVFKIFCLKVITKLHTKVKGMQYQNCIPFTFAMDPTYLKFGTLIKLLKTITFSFQEKLNFPNRKRDNETKQDFKGAHTNP